MYKKESISKESKIDHIQSVANYVMTGNYENGSVNLFTTQLGLDRKLQYNFLK